MKVLRHIWTLIAAALLLWSCAPELVPASQDDVLEDIDLRFDVASEPLTRSGIITEGESEIKEIMILVYQRSGTSTNGTLVATRRCGPHGGVVHLEGVSRMSRYAVYALANLPDQVLSETATTENELKQWTSYIDNPEDLEGYIPMAWSARAQRLYSENTFTIQFKRLVARYDFKLDKSALGNVNITSVRLHQCAQDITPFKTGGSKATEVFDFDYASDADLAELNAGRSMTFYALENRRGDLLSGNTDSWKKIPDNLSEDEAALCTYLEIRAEFNGNLNHSGAVTYRMYLGKNTTTNFDIVRNTINTISLTLTEAGLTKGIDWKVDVSELGNGVDWKLSREVLYLAQKETLTLNGLNIEDISTTAFGRIALEAAADGTYTISALAAGADTVYVRGTDAEGEELSAKIAVDVVAPILGFDDDDLYLALDGTYKTVQPHYYDLDGKLLNDFDEELYARLLSIRFDANVVSSNVNCDIGGESLRAGIVSFAGLEESGTGDIEDRLSLGSVYASAVSEDVVPVSASLYTADPFPASGKLDNCDSKGLLGNLDEEMTLSFGAIREFTDSSAYHIILGKKDAPGTYKCLGWLSNGTIHAKWLYGLNKDLYLPSVSETFSAYVTNQWSGESWWSPRSWYSIFIVHLAIGGNVVYTGGSETNPMSYYVRAIWAHSHDDDSPLQTIQENIVACEEDYHGYYSTGMYTLLYSLDYSTGYPVSADDDLWYEAHRPAFTVTDISASNHLNPVRMSTPCSLSVSNYSFVIYSYSDIRDDSNNWIR